MTAGRTNAIRVPKPPKLTDLQVYILLVAAAKYWRPGATENTVASLYYSHDIPTEIRTKWGTAQCPGIRIGADAARYGTFSLGPFGKTRLKALAARGYLRDTDHGAGRGQCYALTDAGLERVGEESPRIAEFIRAAREQQLLVNDSVARERAGLDK